MSYRVVNTCPITGSEERIMYLDLGLMPLVNNLCDSREESLACDKYPLSVNYYPQSKLTMLSGMVNPDKLFTHYLYKSGVNVPYIEHCIDMYKYISKFTKIENTILDIGGNDGTLLNVFKSLNNNISVINVDPSINLTNHCRQSKIESITDFWSYDVSMKITKCKVITSTNVFQHIENPRDFIKGIYNALCEDGIWCLEFPYWAENLQTNQFDQIYHEHIYYYLVTTLHKLFKEYSLNIIDISRYDIHGGTLRLLVSKSKPITKKIWRYIDSESSFKTDDYVNWGRDVRTHINKCCNILLELKRLGASISGFGAAAKGCIFLNSANIDYRVLDYVVDDTDLKQHKFIPGTGINVVDREELSKNPTDYLLILAHNFSDYIIESIKSVYHGNYIIMFPEVLINGSKT